MPYPAYSEQAFKDALAKELGLPIDEANKITINNMVERYKDKIEKEYDKVEANDESNNESEENNDDEQDQDQEDEQAYPEIGFYQHYNDLKDALDNDEGLEKLYELFYRNKEYLEQLPALKQNLFDYLEQANKLGELENKIDKVSLTELMEQFLNASSKELDVIKEKKQDIYDRDLLTTEEQELYSSLNNLKAALNNDKNPQDLAELYKKCVKSIEDQQASLHSLETEKQQLLNYLGDKVNGDRVNGDMWQMARQQIQGIKHTLSNLRQNSNASDIDYWKLYEDLNKAFKSDPPNLAELHNLFKKCDENISKLGEIAKQHDHNELHIDLGPGSHRTPPAPNREEARNSTRIREYIVKESPPQVKFTQKSDGFHYHMPANEPEHGVHKAELTNTIKLLVTEAAKAYDNKIHIISGSKELAEAVYKECQNRNPKVECTVASTCLFQPPRNDSQQTHVPTSSPPSP